MKIDKNKLNVDTVELLTKAGWFENRKISFKSIYPKEFELPNFVENILENIYGLEVKTEPTIRMKNNMNVSVFYEDIIFNPEFSLGENEDGGTFSHYSKLLKRRFYPLGEITNEVFYIGIDEDRILYLMGDIIFKMGDDFHECLDNLLMGIKGKRLNEETLRWEEY